MKTLCKTLSEFHQLLDNMVSCCQYKKSYFFLKVQSIQYNSVTFTVLLWIPRNSSFFAPFNSLLLLMSQAAHHLVPTRIGLGLVYHPQKRQQISTEKCHAGGSVSAHKRLPGYQVLLKCFLEEINKYISKPICDGQKSSKRLFLMFDVFQKM